MKQISLFVFLVLVAFCDIFASRQLAKEWALPVISVAHVRANPSHSAEMVSQVLMGMPLKVEPSQKGGWYKVETPEGYQGYVINNSLQLLDSAEMSAWRSADRLVVSTHNEIKAYSDTLRCCVVSDLVPGDIVEKVADFNRWTLVSFPDGRQGWILTDVVTPIKDWASQPADADVVIEMAKSQIGAPYVWGGMSVKGMDCSGLSKMAYYQNGRILQRDASQQALCGGRVENVSDLIPGDLLFFGNKQTGRIDHVGIYVGGDRFIESSGRVRLSEVSRQTRLLHACRVFGYEGQSGIARVIDHPWYF